MNSNNRTRVKVRSQKIAFAWMIAVLLAIMMATVRGASLGAALFPEPRQERRYELKGIVKSVDKPKRRAIIQHEKVGDYMGAMTMPFAIKDDKALGEMEPGDRIKATLVVTNDGGEWLEKITILAKGALVS